MKGKRSETETLCRLQLPVFPTYIKSPRDEEIVWENIVCECSSVRIALFPIIRRLIVCGSPRLVFL